MTNEKIYRKAIDKIQNNSKELYIPKIIGIFDDNDILLEIFSHKFAKAFWGEEYVDDRFGESKDEWIERTGSENNWGCHNLRYQYHLQKMVLKKEPVKYLEKFLDECEHDFNDNDGGLLDFCKKCNIKRYKV